MFLLFGRGAGKLSIFYDLVSDIILYFELRIEGEDDPGEVFFDIGINPVFFFEVKSD